MTPKIAVQMVAHNAHDTLREALESVLAQDVPCHIYLVDEGSTPSIAAAFPAYAKHPNITLIRPATRIPVPVARNMLIRSIQDAGHPFMAIMDADDVCLPGRFAKQLAYLEANPDVAWLGTWAKVIDAKGQQIGVIEHPTASPQIDRFMLFNCPFVHPSVLARMDAIRIVGGYNEAYPIANDYELARRIAQHYSVANLPEHLVLYRMSGKNISSKKIRHQMWASFKIQLKHPQPLNPIWYYATLRTLMRAIAPHLLRAIKRKIAV